MSEQVNCSPSLSSIANDVSSELNGDDPVVLSVTPAPSASISQNQDADGYQSLMPQGNSASRSNTDHEIQHLNSTTSDNNSEVSFLSNQSMLVGSWVDQPIIDKIWNEQFVELVDLLPPYELENCSSTEHHEYQYNKHGLPRPKKKTYIPLHVGQSF